MISLKQMRVSSRLLVAGLAVLFGLGLIAAYTLMQIRTDMLAGHNARLKDLVEVSAGIVKNYQKLESDKTLTREDAQKQAKEALRSLRFSNDDYYFVYDFDGRALMVAGKPSIEGNVLLGETDAKGFKLWDAIVGTGKSAEGKGYIDYVFPRAGQTESKPKRAYLLAIPEWNWIVGTGVYVDDADEAVNKAALRYGLLSLAILAVIAAIALMVSRSVVSQLGGEPYDAAESMRKIASGDLGVEITLEDKDDSSLMASLKMMQLKLKNITSAIQENATELTNQVQGFDQVSKNFSDSRSDESVVAIGRAVKKIGKTADILVKSISRFRL